MTDFRNTFLSAAKNQAALEVPVCWLIDIEAPTSPRTRFRLTTNSKRVPRGVNPATGAQLYWDPFPLALGNLSQNTKGDLRGTTINVGNATLEMVELLEELGGLVGSQAIVRLVPAEGPYEPNAERRFDGVIVSTLVRQDVISLTVGSGNVTKKQSPMHRFLADHCGVERFGDARCGYSIISGATNTIGGGFDFCPETLLGCTERGLDEAARGLPNNHPKRFDGCPGCRQISSKA